MMTSAVRLLVTIKTLARNARANSRRARQRPSCRPPSQVRNAIGASRKTHIVNSAFCAIGVLDRYARPAVLGYRQCANLESSIDVHDSASRTRQEARKPFNTQSARPERWKCSISTE